ncbi:helix-turn-helix transcriptional regulator [Sphingobacterium sp. LRF_L2]|uniref:helix-turn-helix transcriptional regulator n=1 Tax=Sphingobacterium sp. LRF_L2 TaxID=3369421 RepID=UPI003F5F6541
MPTPLLQSLNIELYYSILRNNKTEHFESPVNGFLNILQTDQTAINKSAYFIDNNSFLIHSNQNVIHAITKDQIFKWQHRDEQDGTIILFIPFEMVDDFALKLMNDRFDEQKCLLTNRDPRTMLIIHRIKDLIEQGCKVRLDKLRLQSLFTKLFLRQVEGLYEEEGDTHIFLNKDQVEKIQLAKKIIDADLSKSYTITVLAKKVGTNEQYLKKYFKQYFGKTIMSYTTQVRMEHARSLILTGSYRVADVARLTGYKHSTHFTTAFKKYFGFIPNALRYAFVLAYDGISPFFVEIECFVSVL